MNRRGSRAGRPANPEPLVRPRRNDCGSAVRYTVLTMRILASLCLLGVARAAASDACAAEDARHEAAHFLAGYLLGVPIRACSAVGAVTEVELHAPEGAASPTAPVARPAPVPDALESDHVLEPQSDIATV